MLTLKTACFPAPKPLQTVVVARSEFKRECK
jgi:hypothetical protein